MSIRRTFVYGARDDDQFGAGNSFSFRGGDFDLALNTAGASRMFLTASCWLRLWSSRLALDEPGPNHGAAGVLFGGWTFALTAKYESGSPRAIVQAVDNSGSFSGLQRPNLTGVDPRTPGSIEDRLD
jgi:Flp pilus assembly secretin CpaC